MFVDNLEQFITNLHGIVTEVRENSSNLLSKLTAVCTTGNGSVH